MRCLSVHAPLLVYAICAAFPSRKVRDEKFAMALSCESGPVMRASAEQESVLPYAISLLWKKDCPCAGHRA